MDCSHLSHLERFLFMRTYVNFLEDMSKSTDMEKFWQTYISQKNRMAAAKAVRKYIETNFQIHYSHNKKAYFIDFRKYTTKISLQKSIELYNFFFNPKKVTLIYHFE